MRIAFVFHHDPIQRAPGIDVVRLASLTRVLIERGLDVHVLAPVQQAGLLKGHTPVLPIAGTDQGRYDLVKTCYHQSIRLVDARFSGPIVSRIVRVVDQTWPKRDEQLRAELLACQDLISQRACAVALNNQENQKRWLQAYNSPRRTVLTPTGCPRHIPGKGASPYHTSKAVLLFLGSLASSRMVILLNKLAERCLDRAEVHLVGRNKSSLYGKETPLSSLVVDHGEQSEPGLWNYLLHADLGLALAASPHVFDNDLSKVYFYLRAGLPVAIERPAIQTDLVNSLEYGQSFAYGSVRKLVTVCRELIQSPPRNRSSVMERMAMEHSWEKRADVYLGLFQEVVPCLVQRGSNNLNNVTNHPLC